MLLKPLPENIGIVKASAAVPIIVSKDSDLDTSMLADFAIAGLSMAYLLAFPDISAVAWHVASLAYPSLSSYPNRSSASL